MSSSKVLQQIATDILEDLKNLSDIQKAYTSAGGISGGIAGGFVAKGTESATVATIVGSISTGAIIGASMGLAIGSVVQAHMKESQRRKEKKARLEKLEKKALNLIERMKADGFDEYANQVRHLVNAYQDGAIPEDTFLAKMETVALKVAGF